MSARSIGQQAEDYGKAYADGRTLTASDLRDAFLRGAKAQAAVSESIDMLHLPDPSPAPVGSGLRELLDDIHNNVERCAELSTQAADALTHGVLTAHAFGMQLGAADPAAVAQKQAAEKARRK